MNLDLFSFHRYLFIVLFLAIASVATLTFQLGELKTYADIDFFDVMGEGGITLITLVWVFFILISRPSGKVTHLLFTGLTLTHISMLLDFLDEFLLYPEDNTWLTTIESLPAPIGMMIMSIALYQWHLEQVSINTQLRKTERYYRDHSLTDFVTGLYSAKYMKTQLQREIVNAKNVNGNDHNHHENKPKQTLTSTLMLIDIRQFDQFNRKHGDNQGNILLREIAQIILMNLRDSDLACRYASDCFIVLMPNTDTKTAEQVARHIEKSIEHLAFKVGSSTTANYQHVASCVMSFNGKEDHLTVLEQLNDRMRITKQRLHQQQLIKKDVVTQRDNVATKNTIIGLAPVQLKQQTNKYMVN